MTGVRARPPGGASPPGRRWPVSLLLALTLAACAPGGKPWNVLLVTLDTTRADALGCYGNTEVATPNLDRLAAGGVLFEHAITAVPITTPSHSTIFTGTYPTLHGVRDNGRFQLPQARVTLAEVLKQGGYSTGAAIGAFPLTRNWGLDQGFDFYDDHITIEGEDELGRRKAPFRMFFDERPAARVNEAILPFLRERAHEPFFAWIHYWDAHQPYVAPPPFSQLFFQNPYLAEVAYVDRALGVVLDELRRSGRYERTVIAVLADHGEGHGEHEEDTHSMLLYDATLRVPMILRFPGGPAGMRIAERVGTVDIMPTILDVLGLSSPAEVQGRSLLPLVRRPGAQPDNRRAYYAETLSPRLSYGWGELRALYLERWKLVHGPRLELYDLESDSREIENRAPDDPTERLTSNLGLFLRRHSAPSAADAVSEAGAETRERLAALGYLSAGAGPIEIVEELRRDGDPPQTHISNVSIWSQCKVLLDRKDFLEARELSARLVEHEPTNAFYRALHATAYLGLGRLDEAARVVEGGPLQQANRPQALAIASALFSAGQEQRATALVDRVLHEAPDAQAFYFRAEMKGVAGDRAGQETDLRDALDKDPAFDRARRSLAILLAADGRSELAEKEFTRLVASAPLDPVARLNLATFLISVGRHAEAETHLDRAIELNPAYWKAHLARLGLLRETGRHSEAESVLEAIETRSGDPALIAEARKFGESR